MTLQIGEKIRELRKRDGRTQENLADALGVSCQAVSRWEQNSTYPDMTLIPAIANYFGVTIDSLFGYDCERDRRVNEIIERVDACNIPARDDNPDIDKCIETLRNALAEFPGNEKLLLKLAQILSEAGWRRHHEWLYYDDEGFIQHSYDVHQKNEYWLESVRICENLVDSAKDNTTVTEAIYILVLLYRNFGENSKAIEYAKRMPSLKRSREILLCAAADGKDEAMYVGDALLKMASSFAEQCVYGLIANLHHYESDMPIKKINGCIGLFHLICDDGNFGEYNGILIQLYLYLSRIQWERGYRDDAFVSLDKSLEHAKALEAISDGKEHCFTAPLVSFVKCQVGEHSEIAKTLPGDWPFWCNPDYSESEKEIKADPRWDAWVRKTQE